MIMKLGPRQDWAATCSLCEWSSTQPTEEEAKIVSVLHVLMKHPLHYELINGKDPGAMQWEYREQIDKYRKDL